jgi:membrane-associated protease RseP (regulator of RpoE activity)
MLRTSWVAVAALVLWGVGTAEAQTPAEAPAIKIGQFSVSGPAETTVGGGPFQQGGYYLGIACQPVMPALRAQLNLPERQGLLVGAVVPDSPAAAAGIAQHDLLMRIGDKPLSDPQVLLDAVQASKGGKLKIELIRGGKPKTIEVAPAKRPEQAGGMVAQMPSPADWDTVWKWMEGVTPGQRDDAGRSPGTFTIVGPGTIFSKNVFARKPMPADMAIAISKAGNQPAKIKVQRGDEKWESTEEELDKLPADVRPHVEQMLGRGPLGAVGNIQAFELPLPPPGCVATAAPGQPMSHQALPGPGSIDRRIEKRLDEMSGRLDKLLKIMEKMAEDQANHRTLEKGKLPGKE